MSRCGYCGGEGKRKKITNGELYTCPHCDGTGNFIPISEATDARFRKVAPLRTSFADNGRYAGHGMAEDNYSHDYVEPTDPHAERAAMYTPPVVEGETSEVKVYDFSYKLIRIETYIYRASKTRKDGKWELLSVRYD